LRQRGSFDLRTPESRFVIPILEVLKMGGSAPTGEGLQCVYERVISLIGLNTI